MALSHDSKAWKELLKEMEMEMSQEMQMEKPPRKLKQQRRYKTADWARMMEKIQGYIDGGESRVSNHAKLLGVSHWTAAKANRKLQAQVRRAPELDIQALLIDNNKAIRILVPLLDHPNPTVVKKAKGWLLKIAEWL